MLCVQAIIPQMLTYVNINVCSSTKYCCQHSPEVLAEEHRLNPRKVPNLVRHYRVYDLYQGEDKATKRPSAAPACLGGGTRPGQEDIVLRPQGEAGGEDGRSKMSVLFRRQPQVLPFLAVSQRTLKVMNRLYICSVNLTFISCSQEELCFAGISSHVLL